MTPATPARRARPRRPEVTTRVVGSVAVPWHWRPSPWLWPCERIDVVRNVVLRVALLSSALVLLGSGPASAHASLSGSDPKDGATLRTAPTAITFTFNENVGNPAYISVVAPNGSKVDVGKVRAIDNTVTAALPDVNQK